MPFFGGKKGGREKELWCQQVLEPDGSVFSLQSMSLPKASVPSFKAYGLLERYLAFIRRFTLGIVRPAVLPAGIEFRLFRFSCSLLSFAPPRTLREKGGEVVELPIIGGRLVQKAGCRGGVFALRWEEVTDEVQVTVELSGFRSGLLGCSTPSLLRRLLYRFTQAWVHKVATVAFLLDLYHEVTGEKARPRVSSVRLREGRDI